MYYKYLLIILLASPELQAQDTRTISPSTEVEVESGVRVRVLGDREARRFGVNVFTVNRARKQWMASDDYDPNASSQERGIAVASILAQNKETKAAMYEMTKGKSEDAAAMDWESFIALVMKLLDFITKFLIK